MTTLIVEIPEDLRERAEAVAASRGETLDEVVQSALASYARRKPAPGATPADDELASAAREARAYYDTDPDALAWAQLPGDEPDYA